MTSSFTERLTEKFNAMEKPNDVIDWINAPEQDMFGEWPRDSGGFHHAILAAKQCRHGQTLAKQIADLEDYWHRGT
ncbi:hypothetical protein H8K35_14845 [Undibacterium sp. LX40W]|uniref:Uncharacterized protein n=1 Tax=Undibacterium nitidum TaxID=2762298 RepID=A0A923HU58_9BURK|nr:MULTISPECIES: hypothetical protein [Undibacterium]MBC3882667.1 hypothetical protein [Undibacterium nitidum]MBC3892948.1 hypothetical protein [Undibacterium sp. LX40W]